MTELPPEILNQFYLKRLTNSSIRMFEIIEVYLYKYILVKQKLQLLTEPPIPVPFEIPDNNVLTTRNPNVQNI